MTKTFIINKDQKPTEEQLREVMEAKKQPIVFDDDPLKLSPAMYKAFKSSVIQRNREKCKRLKLAEQGTIMWFSAFRLVIYKGLKGKQDDSSSINIYMRAIYNILWEGRVAWENT